MFGERLPLDCICEILSFLTEKEVLKIASASRKWEFSYVARSDRLWKEKFEIMSRNIEISDNGRKIIEEEEVYYHKYLKLRLQGRIFRIENPPLVKKGKGRDGMDEIHTTILGDGAVGKTSMAISFVNNSFPYEYVPTVFDEYNAIVLYENRHTQITISDCNGEKKEIPVSSLKRTTCYILCFSLSDRSTFDRLKTTWVPILKEFCPSVPVILCGTKLENLIWRRDKTKHVLPAEGGELAREIDAFRYIEASGKTQKGLKRLFFSAIEASLWSSSSKGVKERKKRVERLFLEKKETARTKKGKAGCVVM